MLNIEKFANRLNSYLQPCQINMVRRAYFYAEQAHDGQIRRSGIPYINHPLEVAAILADMHMDHQSLMAAMLHDVIEDTGIEKHAIAKQFGETIADLVDGVSKLTHMHFEDRAIAQAENFQKMALAMAKDIRVILIKLSDRLHNMRTLGALNSDKRCRIAKETLEIYAPIANRLGMHMLRIELEDLGFFSLYPVRAKLIERMVNSSRKHQHDLISQVQRTILNRLKKEKINADVLGREKHLYGIYYKMKEQKKSFSDIMDVFAFRVIVNNIDEAYRALGVAHNLYKPIPGRFKDYIAIPKANGYQSLHTTLFGMHGIPIEIQIRTKEMDEMANYGIAAHSFYKSKEEFPPSSRTRISQWLKGVLELQKSAGDSIEFIENVKVDLFPDEIYVFSPKGHIFELPRGATPVDYAYAIHTELGNSCISCRIDKNLSSLSTPLQSGQTVEIVTAPKATPSAGWLDFIVTGKARSHIRNFLKHQRKSESISLGKRLLNKALQSYCLSLSTIDPDILNKQLKNLSIISLENLLEDIGLGNRMAYVIAKILVSNSDKSPQKARIDNSKPIYIRGAESLVVTYGKCCHPIPGDPVIGHVSAGRGMVIHVESCQNINDIRQNNPDKILDVEWDKNVPGEFSVELYIESTRFKGMIAHIATCIAIEDGNIEKISIEEQNAKFFVAQLLINVKNRLHLANIIKKIRIIKGILSIHRRKGS